MSDDPYKAPAVSTSDKQPTAATSKTALVLALCGLILMAGLIAYRNAVHRRQLEALAAEVQARRAADAQ